MYFIFIYKLAHDLFLLVFSLYRAMFIFLIMTFQLSRNLLAVSAETKENCIIVTQRTKPDTLASKLLSNAINNTIDITIGESTSRRKLSSVRDSNNIDGVT